MQYLTEVYKMITPDGYIRRLVHEETRIIKEISSKYRGGYVVRGTTKIYWHHEKDYVVFDSFNNALRSAINLGLVDKNFVKYMD